MKVLSEPFVHGGNIYEYEAPAGGWLDFSANINPLGMAAEVRRAIQENIDGLVHYPDPRGTELKSALAAHYGARPEQLVLGNGAAELLYVFFHHFRPGRVLLPVPSFSEYERAARSAHTAVEYYPLSPRDGFSILQEDFLQQVSMAECVILGNPNNPTGTLIPAVELEKCIRIAALQDAIIIVDESFMDFREDAEKYSVRRLVAEYQNLIILQSMTKFYAIPGLRLGFGIMPAGIAAKLERSKDVWNVNLLAQKAGTAALQALEYQQASRRLIREEMAYLQRELQSLAGVQVYPPAVNFLLLDIAGTGWKAAEFLAAVRQRGVLIRDCSNYPGLQDTYIRIAVRSHQENEQLIRVFQKVLARELAEV